MFSAQAEDKLQSLSMNSAELYNRGGIVRLRCYKVSQTANIQTGPLKNGLTTPSMTALTRKGAVNNDEDNGQAQNEGVLSRSNSTVQ